MSIDRLDLSCCNLLNASGACAAATPSAFAPEITTILLSLEQLQVVISAAPSKSLAAFLESIILTATACNTSQDTVGKCKQALQHLLIAQHPHLQAAWPAAVHSAILQLLRQAFLMSISKENSGTDTAHSEQLQQAGKDASAEAFGSTPKKARKQRASEAASSSLEKPQGTHSRQRLIRLPVLHDLSSKASTDAPRQLDAAEWSAWTALLRTSIEQGNNSSPSEPSANMMPSEAIPSLQQIGPGRPEALQQLAMVLEFVNQLARGALPQQTSLALASLLLQVSQTLMLAAEIASSGRSSGLDTHQHATASTSSATTIDQQAGISRAASASLSALSTLLACNRSVAKGLAGLGTSISSLLLAWVLPGSSMTSSSTGHDLMRQSDAAAPSKNWQTDQHVAGLIETIMGIWLQQQEKPQVDHHSLAAMNAVLKLAISQLKQVKILQAFTGEYFSPRG